MGNLNLIYSIKMNDLYQIMFGSSYDNVDNPFWSVNQIRVKYLLNTKFVNTMWSTVKKARETEFLFPDEKAYRDQE